MKRRRCLLLLLLLLCMAAAGAVQAHTFSIQGVLKDKFGRTLPDAYYTVTLKLYDSETAGNVVWSEVNGNVQTRNGVFVTDLGSVAPFGSVTFAQTYWLGMTVKGGTEMTPRMKLTRIPYSFSVLGANNRFPSSGNVGIGTTSPATDLYVTGSAGVHATVNASSGDAGYQFDSDQSNEWAIRRLSTDNSLRVTEMGVGDAVTFQPGGKVGIGTSDPASRLHVKGLGGTNVDFSANGRLRSDSYGGGLWVSSDRFIGGQGADKFGFLAGGAFRITVQPDGRVGLGTADPSELLDVNGNIKLSAGGVVRFSDGTSLASAKMPGAAEAVANPGNCLLNGDSDRNGAGIVRFSTGAATRAVVANNGKVGIGAPDPAYALDVAGDIRFSGDILKGGSPFSSSSWSTSGASVSYSDGKVGVGKTNPAYALDVAGIVNAREVNKNGQSFSGSSWKSIDSQRIVCTKPSVVICASWTSTYAPSADIRLMLAHSSAHVGGRSSGNDAVSLGALGTGDNYGDMMTIQGNNMQLGTSSQYWQSLYTNKLYYQSIQTFSDRRIKQNVRAVEGGLDKVIKLAGVRYDVNTETHPFYRGREIDQDEKTTGFLGYIAQDLKEVLPEAVEYVDNDKLYGIDYDQLFPVVAEAIDELKQKNDSLEIRIARLEAEANRLEKTKESQ